MASSFISIPFKTAADIDITKPIGTVVANAYKSAERPKDYASTLQELQKLRRLAVRATDKGDATFNAFANYYDQLVVLEQKIPTEKVTAMFNWKDSIERASLFSSAKVSQTISAFAYEKVCVLYNVAAYGSSAAAEQNLASEDGLQKALKRLQLASGIFAYLEESVRLLIQKDATPDLKPESLETFKVLMLAQAQEVVVLKAVQGGMKNASIAKLCAQLTTMYEECKQLMQRDAVKSLMESSWITAVTKKESLFASLAQFHQAKVCNEQKNIGEEIARLTLSKSLLPSSFDPAKPWSEQIDAGLSAAKKDNDYIYHEPVPAAEALEPIAKAAVAKPVRPDGRIGADPVNLFEHWPTADPSRVDQQCVVS